MPDKAGSAGNNGDIFPRSPTQYGAILAAKIVLFLLGISIRLLRRQELVGCDIGHSEAWIVARSPRVAMFAMTGNRLCRQSVARKRRLPGLSL